MVKEGERRFVKYAGAPTAAYTGQPRDAIRRLKRAIPLYEQLRHPYLINLIDHFETEEGYAAVFEWFDGECLHSPTTFPPPAKYQHPDSPYYRFHQLPLELKLNALDRIFSFHKHVEQNEHVAIDFYDGSILYNFKEKTTKLCDIDFYERKPYQNITGRMWGSSRFMSPEEFEYGAAIDERTNVFTMGAIAFSLLGGELDRSFSKWTASHELYEVALKAVRPERQERFSNVHEFYRAWKKQEQSP